MMSHNATPDTSNANENSNCSEWWYILDSETPDNKSGDLDSNDSDWGTTDYDSDSEDEVELMK